MMDRVSIFNPSAIINASVETAIALKQNTSFQIVDRADADSFRAAGQAVLDIARGNKLVTEFANEFKVNKQLGLEVTCDLADIIELAMKPDEITSERHKKLAQIACSTTKAINDNLRDGENWSEIYKTFHQKIIESGELK